MRSSTSVILVALALCARGEIPEEDGVLVLTNETLPEAIRNHPHLLVEFYAPWCGHCKALEPEYSKAAAQLQAENSPIKLGKVDATVYTDLSETYEIPGFPTLKFFSADKPVADFMGQRSAEGIVTWLKRKTGPAAPSITEASELSQLMEKEVAVVGFFKDVNSDEAKTFMETAYKFENTPFAVTSSDALFAEGKIAGPSAVVLFKQFDERRSDFAGQYTVDALSSFIKEQSLPLVVEFTADKAQEIFGGDIKTSVLLFDAKSLPSYRTALENARKVATAHRGKITFVIIDTEDEEASRIVDFFALKKHHLPAYRLVSFGDNEITKFKPDTEDMSEKAISAFVNRYNAKELKPFLLSEDLPADWDATPVKVLVGGNYDNVTRGSGKRVVVELYAPWCGHCKQLAPIWEQLGEKYKSAPDLIVAKFDAAANEVEGLQIYSYPTIKLYLPGAAQAIDYFGARTLEALSTFVDSDGKEQAPAPEEGEPGAGTEGDESSAEVENEAEQDHGHEGHEHEDHDHDHEGHDHDHESHDHKHTEL